MRGGVESCSMVASSAGACRAYSGTTIIPSANIARSKAAHRILFGARSAHRSPFLSPRSTTTSALVRSDAKNSLPVTETIFAIAHFAQHRRVGCLWSREDAFAKIIPRPLSCESLPLCSSSRWRSAGLSGGRYSSQPSTPSEPEIPETAARLVLRDRCPSAPSIEDCAPRFGHRVTNFVGCAVKACRALTIFSSRSGSSTASANARVRVRASGCGCVRPWSLLRRERPRAST